MTSDYEAIKVHVASIAPDAAGSIAPAPAGRPRRRSVYQTVELTADDPAQPILPASDRRVCAWVQPLDNDIVLGPDKSTVAAAGNTVASVPRPSGSLIPHANTQPWPVDDHREVWAGVTTTATSSRVTVTAVYEDPG